MIDEPAEPTAVCTEPLSQAQALWPDFGRIAHSTQSPSPAPERVSTSTSTSTQSESAASTTDSVSTKKAPTKRIRIPIACVNCRHKKIKCDGQVPCSHCEKFRVECIYPAATKPVNHEYVETLENRLKSVESHLQGLLSMGMGRGDGAGVGVGSAEQDARRKSKIPQPDATQEGGPALASETYVDADTAFFATTSTRTASSWTSLSMGNTTPAYNSDFEAPLKSFLEDTTGYDAAIAPAMEGKDSQNIQDDGTAKVLYQLLGNLKINHDGSAQFIPHSYVKARTCSSNNSAASSQLSTLFEINRRLEWESLDTPCPYTLPGNLLPAHAIVALIEIYFKSVHTFLPLFHKTSFMTLFHQNVPGYRVPPFLLMAMCAVASRHATKNEIELLVSKTSMSAQSLLQHHVLFDYARALLDTYIDVPRLSTVKGLLLLTYYQVKEKRVGHFFRMRTYLGLAVRMSLDMGLARGLYSSADEVETTHTGDSDSTVGSLRISSATLSGCLPTQQADSAQQHRTGPEGSSSTRNGRRASKAKHSVEQQEGRLTWLACFFLDSLTAGFLGLDFCVTGIHLEMRKLIREANYTADTAQGATLIFWYLHLDLAQLYRRICDMYRGLPQSSPSTLSSTDNHGNHLMAWSSIRKGADMLSIEHALDKWLANLPNHLVFAPAVTAQKNLWRSSTTAESSSTPSYYTLYLHRFYFSHRLLLYRPWISHSSSSSTIEDLDDPSSAVSRCAAAAKMLTMIGEIIFQNYSWPWPGCGLFAYEMLQAMEIHLFMMIIYHEAKRTQSKDFEDAKGLYLRTMDLLQGYVSLAELSELKKATTVLEQMVSDYLVAPKEKVLPETLLGYTAYSILQQRQHHLLNQHRQQPRCPLQRQDQQQISKEDPPSAAENSPLGPAHISPKVQTISLLTQHQLHIDSRHEPRHTPQTTALRTEDTHMFSPLLANAGYSTFAETSSSMSEASVPAELFQPFPIGLATPQQSAQSSAQTIQQQSPLSSFLYDMDATPPSMSLYDTDPAQDMFTSDYAVPYPYFQQQQQQLQHAQETSEQQPPSPAVEDLLGLGAMGPPPAPPFLQHGSRSSNVPLALSHPPCTQTPSRSGRAGLSYHSLAPPKPPKRILAQSTGSTNSSSRSQSQRPPAPKKPSRLNRRSVVTDSLASPAALAALDQSPQSLSPTSPRLLHGGSMSSPSHELSHRQRPFRTLQAQGPLYGHGALKSSLHTENGDHPAYHELRPVNRATQPEWSFTNVQEYSGLQYLRVNSNVYGSAQQPQHRPNIV